MQPGIPPSMGPGNLPGAQPNPADLENFLKQAEEMRQQVVPNLQAALAQAQQMQQKLQEAQQEIAHTEVEGQAGGGLVKVRLNGHGQVLAVEIDPKVVDPSDVETLQDLVVGALADAAETMRETVKTILGPLAAAAPPPPGA